MENDLIVDKLYNEPCIDTMVNRISDKYINGIITSPPYNINVERSDCYYNNGYSEIDNLSENDYLELRLVEFKQFSRIIKDRGVICYNISYCKENPILPTKLVAKVDRETDFTLADIISWKKQTTIPFQTSPTKLSRIVELIYIFVKKHNLHTFRTNKRISKINHKTKQKFYANYTNYIEAKNNDGYKCKLKAAYSQELVCNLIDIYFPTNTMIYDPFIGIGTTALGCISRKCRYIGSEIDTELYEIARNRITEREKIYVFD